MISVPGYEVYRVVGQGGMSTVYLAKHLVLGRLVALKVMSTFCAADPDFGRRFDIECRTVARLNHPNIVTIYDVGTVDGLPYMAMEYLPGGDMKQRIREGMDPETVVEYLDILTQALNYAHQQGCVHRDIKPENILFRYDGTPVIADFGVVKTLDEDHQRTVIGTVIGTPRYMSPEQAQGFPVTADSDFYSLGVMLHEMLTGYAPFQGDSSVSLLVNHLNTPVPKLPGTLRAFQSLVDGLMHKIASERLSDIAQIQLLAQNGLNKYRKRQGIQQWKARFGFASKAPEVQQAVPEDGRTQVWTTPVHPNMRPFAAVPPSAIKTQRSIVEKGWQLIRYGLMILVATVPTQSSSNDLLATVASRHLEKASTAESQAPLARQNASALSLLKTTDSPIGEGYERCETL